MSEDDQPLSKMSEDDQPLSMLVEGSLKKRKRNDRQKSVTQVVLPKSRKKSTLPSTQPSQSSNYIPSLRSNLLTMVNLFSDPTFNVRDDHLPLLKKLPFWNLINVYRENKFIKEYLTKSDSDITKIMKTYDKATDKFNICGKHLTLTRMDVKLIFGIEDSELVPFREIPRLESSSQLREIYFKGKKELTSAIIKKAMILASNGTTDLDRKSFASLFALYLLSAVFLTHAATRIDWFYLDVVEDLDNLKSIDWSEHIASFLKIELSKTSKWESRGGCVVMLPFWLCEHTSIINPFKSKDHQFPRVFKWDIKTTLKTAMKDELWSEMDTSKFINQLKPTDHEVNLLLGNDSLNKSRNSQILLIEESPEENYANLPRIESQLLLQSREQVEKVKSQETNNLTVICGSGENILLPRLDLTRRIDVQLHHEQNWIDRYTQSPDSNEVVQTLINMKSKHAENQSVDAQFVDSEQQFPDVSSPESQHENEDQINNLFATTPFLSIDNVDENGNQYFSDDYVAHTNTANVVDTNNTIDYVADTDQEIKYDQKLHEDVGICKNILLKLEDKYFPVSLSKADDLQIELLKNEVIRLRNQILLVEKDLENWKTQCAVMEDQLGNILQEKQNLKDNVLLLSDSLKEKENDVEALRSMEIKYQLEIESLTRNIFDNNTNHERDEKESKTKIERLNERISELMKKTDSKEGLKDAIIESLNTKEWESQKLIESLKKNLSNKDKTLEASDEHADVLNHQQIDLQKQIQQQNQKNLQLEDSVKNLMNENRLIQQELQKTLNDKESLNTMKDKKLEEQNQKIEEQNQQISQLQSSVTILKNENISLQQQLEKSKKENEKYFDDLAEINTHAITQAATNKRKPISTRSTTAAKKPKTNEVIEPTSLIRAAMKNVNSRKPIADPDINHYVELLVQKYGQVKKEEQKNFDLKSSLFSKLAIADQKKIKAMNKLIGAEGIVFGCHYDYLVQVCDLWNILNRKEIDGNVINAFGIVLLDLYKNSIDEPNFELGRKPNPTIFDGNISTYMKDKIEELVKAKVTDIFNVDPSYNGLSFFPIYCGNKNKTGHWVLLVFDHSEKVFYYYNSVSLADETIDVYYDNEVFDMIIFLQKLLGNDKHNIVRVKNTPKQRNSLDCGLYVCYFMKKIVQTSLKSLVSQTSMTEFTTTEVQSNPERIQLVIEFLNQRLSWNLEGFEELQRLKTEFDDPMNKEDIKDI